MIIEHLKYGSIGTLITRLETQIRTYDDSVLKAGDRVEIAPTNETSVAITGTVKSVNDDMVVVTLKDGNEREFYRQFLKKTE